MRDSRRATEMLAQRSDGKVQLVFIVGGERYALYQLRCPGKKLGHGHSSEYRYCLLEVYRLLLSVAFGTRRKYVPMLPSTGLVTANGHAASRPSHYGVLRNQEYFPLDT